MVPIKRALEDHAVAATQPLKRRKVAHKLRYKQPGAILTTLIPQDHETVERELEKCIALALREAGFESYKPSAMASFRGQVNEYMHRFSSTVSKSMIASRRKQPEPIDFSKAMASFGHVPSTLAQDLKAEIPVNIAQAPILPSSEPDEALDISKAQELLSRDLGGATEKRKQAWIPSHMPDFPSQHTYKDTPIVEEHEKDARKVREQATKEGMLAEQALRRLMLARQKGTKALRRSREQQGISKSQDEDDAIFQDALNAIMAQERPNGRDPGALDDFQTDGIIDGPAKDNMGATDVDFGAIVNYDKSNWRKGAQDWISAL